MNKHNRYETNLADICSEIEQHTACPRGYLDWHVWAEKMTNKGYIQRKCEICGFYAIWYLPTEGVTL